MTDPVSKISTAADADGEYVLRKIAEADSCDTDAKTKTERARTLRIEAGKRLIEVHAVRSRQASVPDRAVSGTLAGTWRRWLSDNGIAVVTAHRLMKLAGFTEEQREEARSQARDDKRTRRAKTKAAKQSPPYKVGVYAFIVMRFGRKHSSFNGPKERHAPLIEKFGDLWPRDGFLHSEEEAERFAQKYIEVVRPKLDAEEPAKDSDKAKVQRAVDAAVAKALRELKREADAALAAAAKREAEPVITDYRKAYEDMSEKRERYEALLQGIDGTLTREEFKLIRGLLHPDQHPPERQERARRAFDIFNRLERRIVK